MRAPRGYLRARRDTASDTEETREETAGERKRERGREREVLLREMAVKKGEVKGGERDGGGGAKAYRMPCVQRENDDRDSNEPVEARVGERTGRSTNRSPIPKSAGR